MTGIVRWVVSWVVRWQFVIVVVAILLVAVVLGGFVGTVTQSFEPFGTDWFIRLVVFGLLCPMTVTIVIDALMWHFKWRHQAERCE